MEIRKPIGTTKKLFFFFNNLDIKRFIHNHFSLSEVRTELNGSFVERLYILSFILVSMYRMK